ncbi:acyl-phosphate glycerol 3-phosphate acyltransferase [Eubacterium sp. 14-2]|uniref:glycerol-3-phosphate 1-O-acyltransferase PlsY n=1 Tax=Eubacterium sp. 14-2 TaxID=1235790 RepID=UPI00033F6740|nr:glycerol-3-phosphate 1-O-acyltransferase PlsY [Eubacterium sp. 14-2]EOT25530.1 acyl-phosphate glycerol 3-phosphate acyltransferase [Eubacterium sp. 14-2]
MVVNRIICLAIGYIFGLFQTGFIYGKLHHIDIREYGSGNAGTTNTLRTLGWKAGLVTFLGDAGKAILSMLLAWILFHEKYPGQVSLLEMYAGLGTVLGHNFPFYMKFKGGKGIACTAGFLITFYPPLAILCLLVFVVTVAVTRYVSLGSILVSVCFYIQLIVFGQMGYLWVDKELLPETYVVGAVFTVLAIWRHRANVKRLLTGTENKFSISRSGSLNKSK